MSAGAGEVLAAVVSGMFVLAATWFGSWINTRIRRLEQELEVCRRERAGLRQNLQLVVGAIVGLIPERDRLNLLARIDESIEPEAG